MHFWVCLTRTRSLSYLHHLSSPFAISFIQLIANFSLWMSVPSMKANKGRREKKEGKISGRGDSGQRMDYKLKTHLHQLWEGVGEQSDVFKLSLFNWTTLTDDVVQYTTFQEAQLPAQGCTLLVQNGHEISEKKMLRVWKCIYSHCLPRAFVSISTQ